MGFASLSPWSHISLGELERVYIFKYHNLYSNYQDETKVLPFSPYVHMNELLTFIWNYWEFSIGANPYVLTRLSLTYRNIFFVEPLASGRGFDHL